MAETRDLDENTILDVDADGNICAITVEHASDDASIVKRPRLSLRHGPIDNRLDEGLC